jgi:hypothetical protein
MLQARNAEAPTNVRRNKRHEITCADYLRRCKIRINFSGASMAMPVCSAMRTIYASATVRGGRV